MPRTLRNPIQDIRDGKQSSLKHAWLPVWNEYSTYCFPWACPPELQSLKVKNEKVNDDIEALELERELLEQVRYSPTCLHHSSTPHGSR
jgi:hypothetical protein